MIHFCVYLQRLVPVIQCHAGLYFHPTLRQWGTYDHASQQFVPYEDPALAAAGAHAVHAAAQPGVSTAAESAVAMTNVALYASKAAPPQQPQHAQRAAAQQAQRAASAAAYSALGQQAPEQQQQRPAARRKGAVIGAAPKLDAQASGFTPKPCCQFCGGPLFPCLQRFGSALHHLSRGVGYGMRD